VGGTLTAQRNVDGSVLPPTAKCEWRAVGKVRRNCPVRPLSGGRWLADGQSVRIPVSPESELAVGAHWHRSPCLLVAPEPSILAPTHHPLSERCLGLSDACSHPLPIHCPTGVDSRGLTGISGEGPILSLTLLFPAIGSQSRVPIEGFANAVQRVRIPPSPLAPPSDKRRGWPPTGIGLHGPHHAHRHASGAARR